MVDATPVRGTIRPLVWDRGSAVTAVGCYTVIKQDRDDGPSWFVLIDGGSSGLFGEHISEDSAKAAAQADYEARILAAIQTDPRRATPEAPASLKSGEGFATSGAEDRWIEDMKAGVYDDPASLRHQVIEATDPNFIWGALDNVHDGDTTPDDYAAAVSRAIRAALLPAPPSEGVEP